MKSALRAVVAGAFSALVLAPTAASAITFNLAGTGKAKSYTFSSGGLTMTVTPASFNDLNNTVGNPGSGWKVTRNDDGMGIQRSFLDPLELNGYNELLLFTFSEAVKLDSILFGEVDRDDDFDMFVDGVAKGEDINISAANPAYFPDLAISIWLGIGADSLFSMFGGGDDFRVKAISVSRIEQAAVKPPEAAVAAVPLPATLPLMGAGLALAFAVARRRKGING